MTGSFYTPRQVVDYMVEEALVEVLAHRLPLNDDQICRQQLHSLMSYSTDHENTMSMLQAGQKKNIVRCIASIRILDPAVGSGAFPMSILHKLTLALHRVDPENKLWEEEQKRLAQKKASDAFDKHGQEERNQELAAISDTFERYRDSDFGRKLYLIQNSIFGVDVQPIACQIARLRFFISLAIEQERRDNVDNYGIRPLPNLETRFVAADTLGLPLEFGQGDLQSDDIGALKGELNRNRENYFHADNVIDKQKCRAKAKELRLWLLTCLIQKANRDIDAEKFAEECLNGTADIHTIEGFSDGFSVENAVKLARWDPYNQNMRADWFDVEYMLGVGKNFGTKGFDMVIGNPPYIQLQRNGGSLGRRYRHSGFATFAASGDIYQLFYERGCELLIPNLGILAYITSNSWLKTEYGKSTRQYFSENHTPLRLLEMGKDVFANAIVDTNILIVREGKEDRVCRAIDMDRVDDNKKNFPPEETLWTNFRAERDRPWSILSKVEQGIMKKMREKGTPLKEWDISIYRGILTGRNDAFIIDDETREALIEEDTLSAQMVKPILRGRDINRYRVNWTGKWLIDTHNGYGEVPAVNVNDFPAVKQHLDKFYTDLHRRQDQGSTPYNLRNCAYYEDFSKPKIMWIELSKDGRFAYDNTGILCEATCFILTGDHLKYLCAVLNSSIVRWFFHQEAPTSGMGVYRWKKVYIEAIPVPQISPKQEEKLKQLVDRILGRRHTNDAADMLDGAIDQFIYAVYGLTRKEVAVIERYNASVPHDN